MDPIRLLEERQAILLSAVGDLCIQLSTHLPQTNANSILNTLMETEEKVTSDLFIKELPLVTNTSIDVGVALNCMQRMLRHHHSDKLDKDAVPHHHGAYLTLAARPEYKNVGVVSVFLPVIYGSGYNDYAAGRELFFETYVTPRERRSIKVPFHRLNLGEYEINAQYKALTGEDLFPKTEAILAQWHKTLDYLDNASEDTDKSLFPKYRENGDLLDVVVKVPSYLIDKTHPNTQHPVVCFNVQSTANRTMVNPLKDPIERLKLLQALKVITQDDL